MDAEQTHVAQVIDELLNALIDAVPADQRPELDEQARVIRSLLAHGEHFSIEGFIAGEVARALAD